MTGTNWQSYTAVTEPAAADTLLELDVSDTTANAAGTVHQVTVAKLLGQTVWPSGDPTGVKDAAAINAAVSALGSASGTITLMEGQYYLVPGHVTIVLGNVQQIVFDGRWGARVNAVAGTAGDVIRMYNPTTNTSDISWRCGITGVTIDGTSASAGVTGLHIGDIAMLKLDMIIQNFSGAGSIGLHLDNTATWTEESDLRLEVANCTSNVVAEVTTGYQSYGYSNWDFTIFGAPGQDGLVLKNGADLYSGAVKIRGNFDAYTSAITNAVLRLTGACPSGSPDAGQYSDLMTSHLDIQVEQDGSGSYTPYGIYLDTETYISGCYGLINFLGTFTPCNVVPATTVNTYQFSGFAGQVFGDASLGPSGGAWSPGGPLAYTESSAPVYSGTCYPNGNSGDFFPVTLAANTTIALNYSGGQQAGPQRKTFIISQPATGTTTYTVTWPSTATPTLTSPTVKWAGGTKPTMTTGASATDMYELSTLDGITWIGRATQHVS